LCATSNDDERSVMIDRFIDLEEKEVCGAVLVIFMLLDWW